MHRMSWLKWLLLQHDTKTAEVDNGSIAKLALDLAEDLYRLPPPLPRLTFYDLQLHLYRVDACTDTRIALEEAWQVYTTSYPHAALQWQGTKRAAIHKLLRLIHDYIKAAQAHTRHAEPPLTPKNAPIVAAYDDGKHYWMECIYCQCWHGHGRSNGHRLAHCLTQDSPYHYSGYILHMMGQIARPPQQPLHIPHCYWCDARGTGGLAPHLCPQCLSLFAKVSTMEDVSDTVQRLLHGESLRTVAQLPSALAFRMQYIIAEFLEESDEELLDMCAIPRVRLTELRTRNPPAITPSQRWAILARDQFRCQCCGVSPHPDNAVVLEVDHKVSRHHGGTNDEANLHTICFDCNRGKGKKNLPHIQPGM